MTAWFRVPAVMSIFLLLVMICMIGCDGSNASLVPTGQLTEEQKAAIKADDERVNDEESQGSFGKRQKNK